MDIFNAKISDGAKLVYLYVQLNGLKSHEEIAKALNKSTRTIYRYIAELSNLTPVVSSYNNSFSLNNTTTNISKNLTSSDINTESISSLLAKYGKLPLLQGVLERIPENNLQALEYILKRCIQKHKNGQVHNFTAYFFSCITKMWCEAVANTTITEEPAPQIEYEIAIEEPIETIQPDPIAKEKWEEIIDSLPIVDFAKNLWFKTAIPVKYDGNYLFLQVPNEIAKQQIIKRLGNTRINCQFLIAS